ncbi:MAG: flagellar type III secretion system pore protein FliP [Planctomycetota bacterium]
MMPTRNNLIPFNRQAGWVAGINGLVCCWLAFTCTLTFCESGFAQPSPQRHVVPGWSSTNEPSSQPPNQFRSAANGPTEDLGGSLPNEVRRQIGLAIDPTTAPRVAPSPAESTFTRETPMPDDEPTGIQAIADLDELSELINDQSKTLTSREGLGSSIKFALLIGVLSLAPAIILMTTCYVRVIVVLTLLRQAFGSQQLPPTQVLTALSFFLTLLIMAPVWNQVKTEAIDPYTSDTNPISWEEAWDRGTVPIKKFMSDQIVAAGNSDSVALFYRYLPEAESSDVAYSANAASTPNLSLDSMNDVPLNVMLPAFLISELKVAFLLGFQIYLPFLVLDLVVSSVTVSTGMLMLPPTMVSFPLKLILFVMVDGWNLVIGMLLQSFAPFT